MRIFLSTQSIDDPVAAGLLTALQSAGHHVEHSPRNPVDGDDGRWSTWYREGLAAAMDSTERFIIVVDRGWDSSSWMASEAESAITKGLSLAYWNPQNIEVTARGMIGYLRERMPDDVDELVAAIDA